MRVKQCIVRHCKAKGLSEKVDESSTNQRVSKDKPAWQRYLKVGVQLAIGAVVVYFVAQYASQQWDEVRQVEFEASKATLGVAQLLIASGFLLFPIGTWLLMRDLRIELPFHEIWQAYFLSHAAKYLPGSLWSLPGRALLYNRRGVSARNSVEVVFWESGLILVGACLAAAIGLPFLEGFPYRFELALAFLGAAVFLLVFAAVGLSPILGNFFQRSRAEWLGRLGEKMQSQLSYKAVLLVSLFFAADWFVIGLGFSVLVGAFGETVVLNSWLGLTGLFTAAWAAGFVVVFAPGGIGVRDGLLVWGVSRLLGDPYPLVIAGLARLAWMAAELIGLLVSSVVARYARKRAGRVIVSG